MQGVLFHQFPPTAPLLGRTRKLSVTKDLLPHALDSSCWHRQVCFLENLRFTVFLKVFLAQLLFTFFIKMPGYASRHRMPECFAASVGNVSR